MAINSGGFLTLMGVTFAAFASGFGVCLFNLDTVDACVALANSWVDNFRQMGNHMIAWCMAILNGAAKH